MRFIQVGVGGFGKSWLPRLRADRTASLVALVDVDPAALKAARELTGLAASHCFSDCADAFKAVSADAVLNVTPPAVHHQVALAALERGLHVLTEKPLADSMEHACQMVQAAEKAQRTLMVSQDYRFHSWVKTMRQILRSGRFGQPGNMTVRFAKAPRFEGSFCLRMEHPLVADMSIHHFDLMRAVTGYEPLLVYARTWRPPWSWFEHDPCAVAFFEFESGLKVVYEGSWVSRGRETPWEGYWAVECPAGVVELRGGAVHVTLADYPGQDSQVELERMPCEGQDFSLLEFQRAVAEGREPETSGRDNLSSLAMVFAALEAARTGRPVEVKRILQS
jgi:predicted dehydrogenase